MAEINSKGLLNTNRIFHNDPERISLVDGYKYDLNRYEQARMAGTDTAADFFLIENTVLYGMLRERAADYSRRRRMRRSRHDEMIAEIDTVTEKNERMYEENREVILEEDFDKTVRAIGRLALDRSRSTLYPFWSPTNFELMSRKAAQNSWVPMLRDFFGSHRATRLENRTPDEETQKAVTANIMGSMAFLAATQKELLRDASPKQAEFIKSFDGYMHELDVLLLFGHGQIPITFLPSDNREILPWAFPSSLIDDVSGYKFDAFVFYALKEPIEGESSHLGATLISSKVSKGKSELQLVDMAEGAVEGVLVNARAIGSVDEDGRPKAGRTGLGYIEDAVARITERHSLNDPTTEIETSKSNLRKEIFAHGAAMARINLAEIVDSEES